MNKILTLKRPLIWVKRFKYRCGYGVHSPFAFEFITQVIYEKLPYYSYVDIEASDAYKFKKKEGKNLSPKKVNRLLLRLVNRYQPKTIIEAGPPDISSLYLQAGCKITQLINVTTMESFKKYTSDGVDFLYIPCGLDIEFVRDLIYGCLPIINPHSVFVISGIGFDNGIKSLWEELKKDNRVYITFDLYDIGIVFFDDRKIKQHYVVNF